MAADTTCIKMHCDVFDVWTLRLNLHKEQEVIGWCGIWWGEISIEPLVTHHSKEAKKKLARKGTGILNQTAAMQS
jgi:hypothetical protein